MPRIRIAGLYNLFSFTMQVDCPLFPFMIAAICLFSCGVCAFAADVSSGIRLAFQVAENPITNKKYEEAKVLMSKNDTCVDITDRLLALRYTDLGQFSFSHQIIGSFIPKCKFTILCDKDQISDNDERYDRTTEVTELVNGTRYSVIFRAKEKAILPEFEIHFDLLGSQGDDEIQLTVDCHEKTARLKIEGEMAMGAEPYLCKLPGESAFDVFSLAHGPVSSATTKALFNRFNNSAITLSQSKGEVSIFHAIGSPPDAYSFCYEGDAKDGMCAIKLYLDIYNRITSDVITNRQGRITDYVPIDKRYFKSPPGGWLSWYTFYFDITEDKILNQSRWMAEHLGKYNREGEQFYIILDAGWHKAFGYGASLGRDPVAIEGEKFPHGMKWLADQIHSSGLKCGLWLIPQVTAHYTFEEHPEWFMRSVNGNYIPYEYMQFFGSYVIDPTNEDAMENYYKPMWREINDWGYDYYKLDGQNDMAPFYRQHYYAFKKPKDRIEAYRDTLRIIREMVGDHRYLAGCWGIPLDSIGILNASRTGMDIGHSWSEGMESLNVLVTYNHLNNVVWWCDPDILLIGEAKSMEEARTYLSAYALTGQMILLGDDVTKLPPERVEMIKRIFPIVDIRPMDLYQHEKGHKPSVWDLKIEKPFEAWDVVAVFNWQDDNPTDVNIIFADIGLTNATEYLVYDYWNWEVVGKFTERFKVNNLEPHACRVFSVHENKGIPQVLTTSRHITQGAYDLLDCQWLEDRKQLNGTSLLVAGDPYKIAIYLPSGYNVKGFQSGSATLKHQVVGNILEVILESDVNKEISWEIDFGN